MILFLTRKYPPATGGMETFSRELERAYKQPHELLHFGQRQRDIAWVGPLFVAAAVRRRERTKVIHLGDGVLSFLAPVLRRLTGKPVVATFHALELVYPSVLLRVLVDSGLSSLSHIVCVSEYTKQLLIERGYPPARISVITHGANHLAAATSDSTPAAARAELKRLLLAERAELSLTPAFDTADLLLTVGRLVERKGVRWFVNEVIPRLVARPRPLRYLVLGAGPELERLRAEVRSLGLEQQVLLLGRVSDSLLRAAYAAANVFVMPNVPVAGDAEGFGFVAIEAALSGLPVVASRLEGIPSAIHDGKNGSLVPALDRPAFERAIGTLLDDPETARRWGQVASDYTRTHFVWAEVAERYAEVFAQVTK